MWGARRLPLAVGCGLLADLDQRQVGLFESLLEHPGDSGIGGERPSGYGAFEAQPMSSPDLPSLPHVRRT